MRKIEILAKGIHRTVGYIDYEASIYYTKRLNKNIMKSYYGFGISVPILEYLIEEGIKYIVVVCDNKNYHVSVTRFYLLGFDHQDYNDQQIILPMSYFDNSKNDGYLINKAEEKELFVGEYSFKPVTAAQRDEQLSIEVFA